MITLHPSILLDYYFLPKKLNINIRYKNQIFIIAFILFICPQIYCQEIWGNQFYFNTGTSGATQQFGNIEYFNFSNGISGSSQQVGNIVYHDFSNGISGTSQRIGTIVYHNFSDGTSGTSQWIGDFEFHDFSDGISGTSQRIGNIEYHDFNDGTSGTSQRIGNFEYHDFTVSGIQLLQTIAKIKFDAAHPKIEMIKNIKNMSEKELIKKKWLKSNPINK